VGQAVPPGEHGGGDLLLRPLCPEIS